MTDEQRAEISRLAATAHDASQRERHWGYQNTPTDPDEARASSVRYALIRAEAYEARGRLEAAISALAVQHGGDVRMVAEALARVPA